ncbi:hypothetical protein HMN09_00774500 [Mycena chlorophos]|uniref:Uncharacterized protein n=1 Tax=Mycena chlorophos TaxID=658473 RepID=A0A8H6W874_MYCCL|nr:hypothetical protein HMN09_00774500 [Mycena chlorophos]
MERTTFSGDVVHASFASGMNSAQRVLTTSRFRVNRLIKASKPALHTNQSSSSLPLSPSPNQSHTSLPSSTNSKLVAAQTELQACEAHLAAKEAELEVRRAALVRDGLAGRCRALAECGSRWQEAGRAGVISAQGGVHSSTPSDPNKPLPGVSGSDVSLAPSQSASQINLYIEPAHVYTSPSVSPPPSADHHMMLPPADLVPVVSSSKFAPHILARRITEENLVQNAVDDEGSSVAEDDGAALEVVENPRFASASKPPKPPKGLKRNASTKPSGLHRSSTYGASSGSVSTNKSGSGFFGSIRGLFGRKAGSGGSDIGIGSRLKRGKRDNSDDDDDEPDVRSEPPTPVSAPRKRVVSDIGSQRRRRGLTDENNNDLGIRKAEEWVGGQGGLVLPRRANSGEVEDDKGYSSDGGGTLKRRKSRTKSPPGTVRSVDTVASDSTAEVQVVLSTKQKRRSSLGVSGTSTAEALVPPPPATTSAIRPERRSSLPVHPNPRSQNDIPSLMSIVEGVSRANRTGWATYNGVGLGSPTAPTAPASAPVPGLVEVKAPRLDAPVSPTESRGRTTSSSTIVPMQIDGLPRAPGSIFSTPAVPSTFAGPEVVASSSTSLASNGSTSKRPAKSPLRSALRVSSTPSPPASQLAAAVAVASTQPIAIVAPIAVKPIPQSSPLLVPVPIPVPAPVLNGVGNGKGKGPEKETIVDLADDDESDAASIASYATGIEMFEDVADAEHAPGAVSDGEETGTETEHPLPAPPPPPPPKLTNGHIHESPVAEPSSLANPLYRGLWSWRGRAVGFVYGRVSSGGRAYACGCNPRTSPASPDDDDDDDADEEPWDGSVLGRVGEAEADVWQDSSDEDVECQKARKLLTRLARKDKEGDGKGKGKQRSRDA